jgi:hypothetical protein
MPKSPGPTSPSGSKSPNGPRGPENNPFLPLCLTAPEGLATTVAVTIPSAPRVGEPRVKVEMTVFVFGAFSALLSPKEVTCDDSSLLFVARKVSDHPSMRCKGKICFTYNPIARALAPTAKSTAVHTEEVNFMMVF